MYKKPKYIGEIYTDEGTVVLFNPMNAKLAVIPDSLARKYKHMSSIGRYDLKNEYLINNFFVHEDTFVDEQEIVNMIRENVVYSGYLHLTIMPTEQCNFRCIYCYETFQKGKMKVSVAQAIVNYIKKEIVNYKGLLISWFGGEPTLALDIIEFISNSVISICKEYKKRYFADMTTNGYLLTLDVVEKLYKMHIYRYQITLDGGIKTHDKQRLLCNGDKTFTVITNNLLNIKTNFKKKFLGITIRTNLTKEILENSIKDYIAFINNNFANDAIFDFRFRAAWGEKAEDEEKDIYIESVTDAYRYIFSLLQHIEGLNFSGELAELMLGGGVCYAAKRDDYVVGSDGTIYKCTVHFEDKMNRIGYITDNGDFYIDQSKLNYWTKADVFSGACSDCTSKLSCLGIGCPYNRHDDISCNAISNQYDLILPVIAKNMKISTVITSI